MSEAFRDGGSGQSPSRKTAQSRVLPQEQMKTQEAWKYNPSLEQCPPGLSAIRIFKIEDSSYSELKWLFYFHFFSKKEKKVD